MSTEKICIYHGNCADGFTAAWIVKKVHPDCTFIPGFYQSDPPDLTGKIVYMVDFSYKRPIMEKLIAQAEKFIHIDHHTTAINDMEGFDAPNFFTMYSPANDASGALLTWMYFFPEIEVPQFIRHIDDRDRWKFLLPGTREIQANVFSYEYTFENWDFLVNQNLEDQIREGSAIERRMAKDVKELLGIVVRRMNIAGYNVPVANVPYQYGSDICYALAKNEPFAAYYYDKENGREFGLRSAEDGLHVGEIAKIFGGGGHEHASGFRLDFETARRFEL